MTRLSADYGSRGVIFGHAEDMPFNHAPDPADIFLRVTQPIDISEYVRAAVDTSQ